MKIGRVAIISVAAAYLLAAIGGFALAPRPQFTLDDYPLAACTAITPASGRVFYVDLQRGGPDGDGSRERPWHDLQFLVEQGLLGEFQRKFTWLERGLARLTLRPAVSEFEARSKAVIRGGDTVLLSTGNYDLVDLSGLVNRGYVTIAAAPDARVVLSGLDLSGASHFLLRGVEVSAEGAHPLSKHLVTAYRPGPMRADNLVIDGVKIAWTTKVAAASPDEASENAPDGLHLGGDCLTVRNSTFHELESAIKITRGRKVSILNNEIYNFTIDGIQFSGNDIVIRKNAIFNQRVTPEILHPDCMQGQPPDKQVFGPVTITHNLCVRTLNKNSDQSARRSNLDRFGWQGINIFDGRWRGVSVRCNLVMPAAQHGIALYGVEDSVVEHNVVIAGSRDGPLPWIAAMPSKEGRQPANVLIRANQSMGYLNAVQGAPLPVGAMIDLLEINRQDHELMKVMRAPIEGVVLDENSWLMPDIRGLPNLQDDRFDWSSIATGDWPRSLEEAQRDHPLPSACAARD